MIICDFWKTSDNLVMNFRKVKLILRKSVLDFGYKSNWMNWKTSGKVRLNFRKVNLLGKVDSDFWMRWKSLGKMRSRTF